MGRFYIIDGPSVEDLEKSYFDVRTSNDRFAQDEIIMHDVHIPCIFGDEMHLSEITNVSSFYPYLCELIHLFPDMVLYDEFQESVAKTLDDEELNDYIYSCSNEWKERIYETSKTLLLHFEL